MSFDGFYQCWMVYNIAPPSQSLTNPPSRCCCFFVYIKFSVSNVDPPYLLMPHLSGQWSTGEGKTPVEKFCPKFRENIFPAFLRIGTGVFPANLRVVEFCLHKDSNYRQNPFKNFRRFAPVYIFLHIPAGRDSNFSRAK
jgi:hypothetical protein